MTDTNQIAKAGMLTGFAMLALIVIVVLLAGCMQQQYIQPAQTVQATPLGTWNGNHVPAQQMPYRVPVGQPSRAEFIW